MRRTVLIVTAVCMFVGAAVAYAATGNTYKGTTQSFTKGVGSKKKPVPIGFTQNLKATNTDSTKAAEVLIDIKTKIYGLVSNAKQFPTCSNVKMEQMKSDSFCPKLSKFASGGVHSYLGDPSLSMSTRIVCDPGLDVFNAGGGKLWFFFTTDAKHVCAGGALHTGDTRPYPGYVKQQGKYLVTDVPLPDYVSTKVAGRQDFYGSLVTEQLKWFKVTKKVKGKTIGAQSSVGCVKGKRPWSITYTSTPDAGKTKHVSTVTGSSKC